jgi:hypothetical protein
MNGGGRVKKVKGKEKTPVPKFFSLQANQVAARSKRIKRRRSEKKEELHHPSQRKR